MYVFNSFVTPLPEALAATIFTLLPSSVHSIVASSRTADSFSRTVWRREPYPPLVCCDASAGRNTLWRVLRTSGRAPRLGGFPRRAGRHGAFVDSLHPRPVLSRH